MKNLAVNWSNDGVLACDRIFTRHGVSEMQTSQDRFDLASSRRRQRRWQTLDLNQQNDPNAQIVG